MSIKSKSELMKERWKDPKWREFMSKRISEGNKKTRTGQKRSEQTRKRISEGVKKSHEKMTDEEKQQRKSNIAKAIKKRQINKPKKEKPKYYKRPRIKKPKIVKPKKSKEERAEQRRQYWASEKGKKHKEYLSKLAKKQWEDGIHPRTFSKEHRQKISDSISKGITEGKPNGYFNYSKRGHYKSHKCKNAYYRSAYELKAFVLLDTDDQVIKYKHDAVRIQYVLDGIKKYYIIDLHIFYKDGSEKFVEIKPKDLLNKKDMVKKIEAAKLKYGGKFEVWTEKELSIKDAHKLYDELIPELQQQNLV